METPIDDGATIIRADPRYRRRCIALHAVLTAAGAALVYWLPESMREWAVAADRRHAIDVMGWVLPAIFLAFLPVAAYNLRLAGRVRRAGRYPVAGARVLADTRVRRGPAVRRLALRLAVAGWVIAAIAVGAAAYSHFAIGKLRYLVSHDAR
jgi:hypothetical protein